MGKEQNVNRKLTISTAGLPDDMQRRVAMAATLLASSGIRARIQPWVDARGGMLIADTDDIAGRSAVSRARRQGLPTIIVTASGQSAWKDVPTFAAATQVADLVRHIKEVAFPGQDDAAADAEISGLLRICTAADADAHAPLYVACGTLMVQLRKHASRIHAARHGDLLAAQTRLLDDSWKLERIAALPPEPMEAAASLDVFLTQACQQHEARLPPLAGSAYSLATWPDLGGLPNDLDALRMSAALVRDAWSVDGLARHCDVSTQRANGFCTAMLASGLLELDASPVPVNTAPSMRTFASPLLSRLAQRFGLTRAARSSA